MKFKSPHIYPCLWFNQNGAEAADFYCEVFPESLIEQKSYYGAGMHLPEGTLMTAKIKISGYELLILNGGPYFTLSECVSLVITCDTQEEIDYYWNKLVEGGKPSNCGWLKDKFGLSWQVVPSKLGEWMTGPNAGKVAKAFMKMQKFDLKELEEAAG